MWSRILFWLDALTSPGATSCLTSLVEIKNTHLLQKGSARSYSEEMCLTLLNQTYLNLFIFIYLWLCWVFVSVRGLSLAAASGGHSSSRCAGPSLSRPLLLRSTGSRRAGSAAVAHGPSCSAACGILPDQGSNPCPLHWQADSQPLRHQGSPEMIFLIQRISVIECSFFHDFCILLNQKMCEVWDNVYLFLYCFSTNTASINLASHLNFLNSGFFILQMEM